MVEVRISYETLFDILRREKQKEELQDLPETFISDFKTYLKEKEAILKKEKEEGNPFIVREQESVRLQVHNIKKILRELFERRENKIIRLSQDKVRTGQNPYHLLLEEQSLYEALYAGVRDHRTLFVHALLSGKLITDETQTAAYPNEPTIFTNQTHQHDIPVHLSVKQEAPLKDEPPEHEDADHEASILHNTKTPETETYTSPDITTMKVRILSPLPQFVGTELEVYGPYNQEDVASLPTMIAELLIRKGRAEEVVR